MNSKLSVVNVHLARLVFVTAAIFAVSVTLLATLTGETTLLLGTALGLASAGYALQVSRQPKVEVVAVRRRHPATAA